MTVGVEGREEPRGKASATVRGLLTLVVLVAAALRLWYGWAWPDESRFWDEGYALENVRSILVEETLRPVKSYYPSPVFNLPPALIVEALGQRLDRADRKVFDPASGTFGPWGYRICRSLQALAGILALLALYALGRGLFGPWVGLLAASLLAFVPWHVHASGIFKPDALLTLGVLVSLAAGTRLLERPGVGWAVATGAGVALATSAKLTGVLVSVPLALSGLWLWRREPRRWLALVAAGVTSFVLFVLANPYWQAYLHFVGGLQEDYAMRAQWAGMTRWQVPVRFLGLLIGRTGLGMWAGTAAALSYGWLAVGSLRSMKARSPARRAALGSVLLFPPLYVAAYAVQTAYFKDNNFLPLLPIFALSLAAVSVSLGRDGRWRFVGPAAVSVLVGSVCWMGWSYVYRSLVPSTRDAALAHAARWRRSEGRLVAIRGLPENLPRWEEGNRHRVPAALVPVDGRSEGSPSLDRFDAEILPATEGSERLESSSRRAVGKAMTFEPKPFVLRGTAATVIRHPWRPRGGRTLDLEGCGAAARCADLPADVGGTWVSVSLWLGFKTGGSRRVPRLRIGEEDLPLHVAAKRRRGLLLTSERLRLGQGPAILHLTGTGWRRGDNLRLLSWRPPRKRSAGDRRVEPTPP